MVARDPGLPADSIRSDRSDRVDDEAEWVHAARSALNVKCRDRDADAAGEEAWNRLYAEYGEIINGLVRRFYDHEHDQLDCTQHIWTTIVARMSRFEYDPGRGHVRDWLLVVARHALAGYLLRSLRRRLDRLDSELMRQLPSRESDPATLYERRALRDEVESLLHELKTKVSETSYNAFYCHWIEERSVREIGERLRLTPKQVRDRLARVNGVFRALAARQARESSPLPGPGTTDLGSGGRGLGG